MSPNLRKFIGTAILLAFIAIYALVAMAIGGIRFADAPNWQQVAFYIVAGLAWVPPSMVIIRWMLRPR